MLHPMIWAMGVVSLFTDLGSEMIYPLLPVFLTSVLMVGTRELGAIEGIAEAVSAILKVVSGQWSDKVKKRLPPILFGYSLAALMRPLIGLATSWPIVLFIRFSDRVGKGIRTSPRDAMIADYTPEKLRGRAYGLQRSLDHTGAALGPLVAWVLINQLHMPLRSVFLWAFLPGGISLLVLYFFVREPKSKEVASEVTFDLKELRQMVRSNHNFKWLLISMLIYNLGNSADAFLILKLTESGLNPAHVPLCWTGLHLVKITATYIGGRLSDHHGAIKLLGIGLLYFALIYLGMGIVKSLVPTVILFLAYGIFFGFLEPSERSAVSMMVSPNQRGTAFGIYYLVAGLMAFPASFIFGSLWYYFSSSTAFLFGGLLAMISALMLFKFIRK